MIEKGPKDNVHFPEFKNGCYYGREEDCCWVCFVRFILSPLRQPVPDDVDSTSEHDHRDERQNPYGRSE